MARTGEPEWVEPTYVTGSSVLASGIATYDAMGRLATYRDVPASGIDNVNLTRAYDANGNIRRVTSTYRSMLATGALATTTSSATHWYRYDSMNRTVVSKGILSGGTIIRSTVGTDLTYDAAGQRKTAQTGSGAQEVYGYNNAGLISSVVIGGVMRAATSFDLLGRINGHAEYNASGTIVHDRHSIVYDARGLVLSEKARTREGSDWIYTHIVNYYSADGTGSNQPAITSSSKIGSATGSILYYSETKYWKNGTNPPYYGTPGNYSSYDLAYADAYSSYDYTWYDGPRQLYVSLTNRDGTSQSQYRYDRDLQLDQVQITGGARPRTVSYANNIGGQVISRSESDNNSSLSDPSSRSYFFAGQQMGEVSNNGTENVSYTTWIGNRTNVDGSGPFREGLNTASIFADFDQNYTAMNGGVQASAPGGYVVQAGDTLAGIAASLWGDASLWYKLAEANGLSGAGALTQGQMLTIPTSIANIHNNADTFRPYDPAKAIGDVSPNTPLPPKAKNKCGVFGQILVAVVAIAVVALTQQYQVFSALGPVLGGAATAATASVASQGYGVATGIQDKFSWKGVGIAALSGGIGGAVAPGANLLGRVAVGAATNAATQGVAVATGLQSKFDFAGVAAAGVGAGIGYAVGSRTVSLGQFGSDLASGMAAGIANAATRSAIKGNSFGDNLMAALPDAIGQALGSAAARGVGALARAVGEGAIANPSEGGVQTTGRNAEEIVVTGLFDGDGVNNRLVQDSLVGLGSGMAVGGGANRMTSLSEAEIVVTAPRDMVYLLDETRMSDVRFSGFLNSVANGLNSRDAALWWQNRASTARANTVTAPRPATSRGFMGTLADLNRGLVDFAQARHGGAAFDRTVQRIAGAARGLAGTATDIAILTAPGDPRFMGALDRTLARGAATVAGLGRSVGMVVAGAGGLTDVAITGRGSVGQSAAYLTQGAIETGVVLLPSTRLMGTTKVGVAAESAVPNGKFYSVAFETKLNPTSYPGVSRGRHFQESNEAFLKAMEGDAAFAKSMRDMGIDLQRTPKGLAPRTSPDNWTWHHDQGPGVMQLVPRTQHQPGSIFQDALHPNGKGGYSIWGKE